MEYQLRAWLLNLINSLTLINSYTAEEFLEQRIQSLVNHVKGIHINPTSEQLLAVRPYILKLRDLNLWVTSARRDECGQCLSDIYSIMGLEMPPHAFHSLISSYQGFIQEAIDFPSTPVRHAESPIRTPIDRSTPVLADPPTMEAKPVVVPWYKCGCLRRPKIEDSNTNSK